MILDERLVGQKRRGGGGFGRRALFARLDAAVHVELRSRRILNRLGCALLYGAVWELIHIRYTSTGHISYFRL